MSNITNKTVCSDRQGKNVAIGRTRACKQIQQQRRLVTMVNAVHVDKKMRVRLYARLVRFAHRRTLNVDRVSRLSCPQDVSGVSRFFSFSLPNEVRAPREMSSSSRDCQTAMVGFRQWLYNRQRCGFDAHSAKFRRLPRQRRWTTRVDSLRQALRRSRCYSRAVARRVKR